jgi:hypothetical protein
MSQVTLERMVREGDVEISAPLKALGITRSSFFRDLIGEILVQVPTLRYDNRRAGRPALPVPYQSRAAQLVAQGKWAWVPPNEADRSWLPPDQPAYFRLSLG